MVLEMNVRYIYFLLFLLKFEIFFLKLERDFFDFFE